MSKIDQVFQDLCNKILTEGREYENKNRGVKRLQIPSYTLRHSFKDGFPAITNKKLYWKGIVTEALWFLKGDTDIKYLNDNGVKIWNKDAFNSYVKQYSNNDPIEGQEEFYVKTEHGYRMFTFEEFDERGVGSVGANYSKQWRNFCGVDQIKRLIEDMQKDIMSSRLKVNAWNPAEIFDTALPPCHSEFQVIGVPLTLQERLDVAHEQGEMHELKSIAEFSTSEDDMKRLMDAFYAYSIPEFGFELHWNQRSVDTFLGLPFNIASYGLLAKILESVTGYPALGIEGTLKCVHFYDNQYEASRELVNRDADKHPNCEVELPNVKKEEGMSDYEYFEHYLQNVTPKDFKLVGYTSDEAIKVDMLAPKQI